MTADIVIVDYGMGNIHSVFNAFSFLGCKVKLSSDPEVILKAPKLVLPGVGSFRAAMARLDSLFISDAIKQAVTTNGSTILGICLGLQLLAESSSEEAETSGLALVNGKIGEFTNLGSELVKIPHVGFDQVDVASGSKLMDGLGPFSDFYFVHSYRLKATSSLGPHSTCSYGGGFLATIEIDNVYGAQFHPEKSQINGLKVLSNFIGL